MERVGLLAGAGHLPVECAKAAKRLGFEVYAVRLLDESAADLKDCTAECVDISIGHIDAILNYLKEKGIKKVTMLGKVTKELLFNGKVQPDARMLELIMALPDRKDDTIMMMFVRELAKAGMQAFDQTALLRMLMPHRGVLTELAPTKEQQKDMEFGFRIAKELGRLDIGQTVVVKNMAVMALEAIEGTDACIERGGKLANGGAVVVKVAKPEQDNRFDVPTVGKATVEKMIEVGATALAIEADKTLFVEKEDVLALAKEHGITIAAI
ncbi:LpxI family protein [uncultured Selenomonas sp.]|uniref:LpxI family protein n=1 Tax=uncultured Selenomonas sp. TaxID=159275 RepID=UPI0025F64419|nr:UDP-2,3-diacylglucosamine diphosphatase LpxI [uncultured Selenomonas sp.]